MDLTEARIAAKAKMTGFCAVYKVCDGLPDRFCQGIKYGKAIGMGGIGKGESFAANVNREQIAKCADLGLNLDDFVDLGVKAMKEIAPTLGL